MEIRPVESGSDLSPAPVDTTKRSFGGKIVDYDPPMSPVPGRSAPTFRSPMASNIKTKARGAARIPIQDARSIIDKGPGARKDEVEFSGIHGMLDGIEAAGHKHVDVQALLDHISQHGPDVRLEHAGHAGGGVPGSANLHDWFRDNISDDMHWDYEEDDGYQYEEDHRYHRDDISKELEGARTDYLDLPLSQRYLSDLRESYDKSQQQRLFDEMGPAHYDAPEIRQGGVRRDMTPGEVESAIAGFDESEKESEWPEEILSHYEDWLHDRLGEDGSERSAFDAALNAKANMSLRNAPDARLRIDAIHPAAWDLRSGSATEHPFVPSHNIEEYAHNLADSRMEDWENPYLGKYTSISLENGDSVYINKSADGEYTASDQRGRQIASGNYSINQLIDEIADHFSEDYDDDELIDMFGHAAAPGPVDHAGQPDLEYRPSLPPRNSPYSEYTAPGGDNYQAFQLRLDNPSESSDLQHSGFSDNTFAHIRTKDRDTVDPATGKTHKILYVEEIQSDLHQKGTENGYHDDAKYQQYVDARRKKDLIHELIEDMAKHRADSGFGPQNPSAADHSDFFEEVYPRVAESADRIMEHRGGTFPEQSAAIDRELDALGLRKYSREPGTRHVADEGERSSHFTKAYQNSAPNFSSGGTTPDFPFKKDWEEKAIQAITRYAAEHGYDGIAISPSTDHIERFGTSTAKIWNRDPSTGQVTLRTVSPSTLGSDTVKRSGITQFLHRVAPDYIAGLFDDGGGSQDAPQVIGRTPEEIAFRQRHNASLVRSINQDPSAPYGVWSERNPGFESAYDVRFPSTLAKIGKQHGVDVIPTEPEGLSQQISHDDLAELHSRMAKYAAKYAPVRRNADMLSLYINNIVGATNSAAAESLRNEDAAAGNRPDTLRRKLIDIANGLRRGPGAYQWTADDRDTLSAFDRVLRANIVSADPDGRHGGEIPDYESILNYDTAGARVESDDHRTLPTTRKTAPTLLFTPEMREKLISEGFKLSDEAAGGAVRLGNCNKYAVTLNGEPILQPTGRLELAERCMEAIALSETPAAKLLDMAVRGTGARRPYWQFLSDRPSAGVAMLHETIKPEFREVLAGGGDKFHFVDKMLRERAAHGGASHPGRFHPGRTGLSGVLGVERVA